MVDSVMDTECSNTNPPGKRRPIRAEDSVKLSQAILHCANRGLPRADFLREVSELLLAFSGCDAIEVRLNDGGLHYCWEAAIRPKKSVRFDLARWLRTESGRVIPASDAGTDLERLCKDVALRRFNPESPFFTDNGSFWTGDAWEPMIAAKAGEQPADSEPWCVGGHYRSLAVIRFFVDEKTIGLLHIKGERPNSFIEEEVEFYEGIAQTLGLAVADRRAEAALRERVKELTCLYGIAQVVERAGNSLGEVLQQIAELLPPAWQHPEMTTARIILDGHSYLTPGFRPSTYQQSADIVVGGRRRGAVEVAYLEERPEFTAGAFLKEEEKLINAIAREVAVIIDRTESGEEKAKLEQQLMHADRLATIGELAAGVAHELNEPLGSILGFAQLAKKCPDLPELVERDIRKIENASLYAREVIKKLMVFARQMPARKTQVGLNKVVEEAFFFLESRCLKGGIEVVRELAPNLPEIAADPSQLKQVFVNLVVNAAQAMPEGGTLTVSTRESDSCVSLVVEDSGSGMDETTVDKIFLPFFTTKDVNEGTGLGLAVVHGIVTAHGGTIDVASQPGHGTRFEIHLPTTSPEETQEVAHNGVCG
jgi:two-component system NtrC family sensor kinase